MPPDDEAQRVELIGRLERSVAVVLSEGHRLLRDRGRLAVAPWEALGGGVVLSRDGLVLTAAHVVAEGERVLVKVQALEEPVPARIVFIDEPSDVALLRLEEVPVPLAPARLGNSSLVRKGQTVYAIGNPTGLEYSLSVGVVSGRHEVPRVFGGSVQAEVIQTDAALNTGNSGGPLFNSRGEVIAIARSIVSESGGSQGIGFGLAINVVKKILGLDPCIWLGFSGVPVDERWSQALNVPRGGVLVQRVSRGDAAAQAGLRGGHTPVRVGGETLLLGGDVVLRVDGQPILEWLRKPPAFRGKPGERHELRLAVFRGGRILEMPIVEVHRAAW